MEFKLKINPGHEARKFLESRVKMMRSAKPEDGLYRLKEDIPLIFTGRYDKLKKDSRYIQGFLGKQPDLRGEEFSLGDTLIGVFSILDKEYNEKITQKGEDESRTEIEQEYFNSKLEALERVFAGDISVFAHILIGIFLRHTHQQDKLEEENLEKIKERFRAFVEEGELLLRFFFHLDEFSRLNRSRAEIDRDKKSSLSAALEDEILMGKTTAELKKQIVACRKLEHLAGKLVEISQEHEPLSGVKLVLNEANSEGQDAGLAKGLLERFREHYELTLELTLEALVYKRIIHLNSGSKEAKTNRKKWLEAISYAEIDRLINLLNVKDDSGSGLSQEQKDRKELFQKLRGKLDKDNADQEDVSKRSNTLEEGDMNLLVMRLSDVSLLEDQIAAVEQRLEKYRQENKVDQQNTAVKAYGDNLNRLSECLYYFIELSGLSKAELKAKGKELQTEFREQMNELDTRLKAEMGYTEEEPAGESTDKKDRDRAETTAQKEAPGAEIQPREVLKSIEAIRDPEKKATMLAEQLMELPDSAKIKPLKELACIGGLGDLPQILPLSQYSSGFLRKLARGAVIKIILRGFKEDEKTGKIGIQQKKKLIDLVVGLDKKYSYLREIEAGDPKFREKIYDIIIKEDKDFTARTLGEIIVDSDERVRATAVKLIADMLDQEETGLLVKLLGDPDARVRANVIECLEEIGHRNTLGILMKYKFDKDNRVRANAIKAIWNFGHRDVMDTLEEMLLDFDPKMRASATWVIGEIGHNEPDIKNLLNAVTNDSEEIVGRNLELARRKIAGREEGLRVLLVDDDKQLCDRISRGLIAEGYKTSVVHDGKAALSAAEENKPHAILLDLRLPEMNGLEVLKVLRTKEDTRETPVVVFCDFNSSVLINKANEAGADSYLIKPLSYEQVKRKLGDYT